MSWSRYHIRPLKTMGSRIHTLIPLVKEAKCQPLFNHKGTRLNLWWLQQEWEGALISNTTYYSQCLRPTLGWEAAIRRGLGEEHHLTIMETQLMSCPINLVDTLLLESDQEEEWKSLTSNPKKRVLSNLIQLFLINIIRATMATKRMETENQTRIIISTCHLKEESQTNMSLSKISSLMLGRRGLIQVPAFWVISSQKEMTLDHFLGKAVEIFTEARAE